MVLHSLYVQLRLINLISSVNCELSALFGLDETL